MAWLVVKDEDGLWSVSRALLDGASGCQDQTRAEGTAIGRPSNSFGASLTDPLPYSPGMIPPVRTDFMGSTQGRFSGLFPLGKHVHEW